MPLCVLLNITEKQAKRANATLIKANPCQLGRDARFLLPVYQHVHLALSESLSTPTKMPIPCRQRSETDAAAAKTKRKPARWAGGCVVSYRRIRAHLSVPRARYHLYQQAGFLTAMPEFHARKRMRQVSVPFEHLQSAGATLRMPLFNRSVHGSGQEFRVVSRCQCGCERSCRPGKGLARDSILGVGSLRTIH